MNIVGNLLWIFTSPFKWRRLRKGQWECICLDKEKYNIRDERIARLELKTIWMHGAPMGRPRWVIYCSICGCEVRGMSRNFWSTLHTIHKHLENHREPMSLPRWLKK